MAGGRLFCVVVLSMAFAVGAFAAPAGADVFAPDSYVEKPLADDAPLDPNSATMIATLRLEIEQQFNAPRVQDKPTVDNLWCTPHVYTVPASQPLVDVDLPADASPALRQQLSKVPIPSHAWTGNCPDFPLVINQPSTNKMWDIWLARKDSTTGRWSAVYGGLITPDNGMRGLSQNPGHWEDPPNGFGRRFGTAATSIPKLAGLATISELQAGQVGHVLAFNMQAPAPCWRWPAQRMDGRTLYSDTDSIPGSAVAMAQKPQSPYGAIMNNPAAPPYGAILRLPASLDIDALNLPTFTETMAKAVQRHGMVLADRGNQMGFVTEMAPRELGIPGHESDPDPYGPIFEGRSRVDLVRAFPWDKLEVVAARPGTNPCQTQ
jgi:hypothetical protein